MVVFLMKLFKAKRKKPRHSGSKENKRILILLVGEIKEKQKYISEQFYRQWIFNLCV